MSHYKHFIFDLDGTLTDPSDGIFLSLQYAFERIQREPPARDIVLKVIGPPLMEMLRILLPDVHQEELDHAFKFYRERYADVGLFENTVYPGIREILDSLRKIATLSIATSKPQPFAERILQKFDLHSYFAEIVGEQTQGPNKGKDWLIAQAMSKSNIPAEQTVMIGDREFDIIGAQKNRIDSIGVLWGFGSKAEFEKAGATRIIKSPSAILESEIKK